MTVRNEGERKKFPAGRRELEGLASVLKDSRISVFEYEPQTDVFVSYNGDFGLEKRIPDFLSYLETESGVHPEDRWKVREFFEGKFRGEVAIRFQDETGGERRQVLNSVFLKGDGGTEDVILGVIRDQTMEQEREALLEHQAKRDSLTGLYNQRFGRELINEYLMQKTPMASCGLMVLDIDYFKNVNDTYGHLFGDQVLAALAGLLRMIFDKKDILMRAGGDEFAVLLKDISHAVLVRRAIQLMEEVRQLKFPGEDYSMTCSVGICFLPENVAGYSYEQLFANADWALYRAKETGRNRFVFCDNLYRYEEAKISEMPETDQVDTRYLHNDVVSTAFEIFEKTSSFQTAMDLLLKVIGIRFGLDRITVVRTDIRAQKAGKEMGWQAEGVKDVLGAPGSFTKEDFLTLFRSYDEYGTTVLQYDNLGMYSDGAKALLMQGGAKTVVYAAMYCEGTYVGAISYVDCSQKRYWTRQQRSQLGEVTKIISAHIAKNAALNASYQSMGMLADYDSLTGLLSFSRFRDEAERLIVGGYGTSRMMVYSDFVNFKYFNQKYGYSMGDQVLKEFAGFMSEKLDGVPEVYFTRVVSDQFLIFAPCEDQETAVRMIREASQEFVDVIAGKYPEIQFHLRSGVYIIEPTCLSASTAIDAANFARLQIKRHSNVTVRLFDRELADIQYMRNELSSIIDKAMENGQFLVYLQPKFSMEDYSLSGAEALVRLVLDDGTIVPPDQFISIYEKSGRIIDLDFYVFRKVVEFLKENQEKGRRQVPISVNASILHASEDGAVDRYLAILNEYGVDPSLTEIELTETATVKDYDNVIRLFHKLRENGIRTAMDDFGAGYSVLNTVFDIPVDTVKVDKSLVNHCESSCRGIYFLQSMVSMVKGLGRRVICEGLETEAQVQMLKDAGCDEGQGYWYSPPLTMEEYVARFYAVSDSNFSK